MFKACYNSICQRLQIPLVFLFLSPLLTSLNTPPQRASDLTDTLEEVLREFQLLYWCLGLSLKM